MGKQKTESYYTETQQKINSKRKKILFLALEGLKIYRTLETRAALQKLVCIFIHDLALR